MTGLFDRACSFCGEPGFECGQEIVDGEIMAHYTCEDCGYGARWRPEYPEPELVEKLDALESEVGLSTAGWEQRYPRPSERTAVDPSTDSSWRLHQRYTHHKSVPH
ncbi:hypothetical protein BRC94_13140 [Halobacteriales archaeon QS_5_70_17]|nr:MAG: hypothetical protein BRC94_13140 [Halobacteriales archaeon QS_5_70_17]